MNRTTQSPPQDNGPITTDTEIVPEAPLLFAAYLKRLLGIWFHYILTATLFFFLVQMVTWLPDIDRWALDLLHHRSILTHSILLPLLIWLVLPRKVSIVASILFAACGIHLSADILSSSVGYGAIWLPAPFKISLGEASRVWILVNAIAAFVMALKASPERYMHSLILGTMISCIFYGLANEGSGISALVSTAFFSGGVLIYSCIWLLPNSPFSLTALLVSRREKSKFLIAAEKKKQKVERGRFWLIKSILHFPYSVARFLFGGAKWSFRNPKAAISLAVITLLTLIWFYAVGSSSSISVAGAVADGAVRTVSDGVWVLHSSG